MNQDQEMILETPKKRVGWFSTKTLDIVTKRLSKISRRNPERRVKCRFPSSAIKLHPTRDDEPTLRKELRKYRLLAFPLFYDYHFSLLVFDVRDGMIYFYNSIIGLHGDHMTHVTDLKKKLKNAGVKTPIKVKKYFAPAQPPGNLDCAAYVFAFLYMLVVHGGCRFKKTIKNPLSHYSEKYIPNMVEILTRVEENNEQQ